MLEQLLTTDCCRGLIRYARKRGWNLKRIARVMGRPVEYVQRVESRKQSFQLSDVEALARSLKMEPHRLVFESVMRGELPAEMQELYDLGRSEIERHEEFVRVLKRKPAKRRTTSKAA